MRWQRSPVFPNPIFLRSRPDGCPPSDKLLYKLEEYLKLESGHLQHMAHVERMPADVRQDYEAIDAENRQYKQLKDVIRHQLEPDKLGELLNSCDFDAMPELSS